MSRVAKVIVSAENKTGSGIKAAAQTINGFGRDVQKVGNLISKAFVVTAIAGFGKKLASVAADMESAWAQQEKALLGFEAAMRGATQISSSGASGLKAFAQSMASLVGVDDQVVLSFETLLATSGRTEEQIRAIISAAADMSAATGKDLKTSVEQLNKTFGGTAGELGEILPGMKDLTKEQLLAGDAIEFVAGQYDGMAEALSGSAQVSIDNYTNAVGDLKESLGALISEGMTPLRTWLTDLTRQWTAAIDVARSYAKVQKAIADKDSGALILLSDSDLKAAADKQEQIARDMYNAIVKGAAYDMGGGVQVRGQMLSSAYGAATDQLQAMRLEQDRRATATPAASSSKPSISSKPKDKTDEEKAWDAFIEANQVGWRPVDSGIGDDPEIAAMMESFTMSSEERILAANEALLAGMQNNPASISEGGSIFGGADMSFGALLGEALGIDEIPGMFADFAGSLGNLQAILNPIQTILQGMFDVLGPLLEDLLAPISGMLQIFGQIIAQMLIPVINILTPVIEGLAKMMVWFANKIMIPVGNFIIKMWNGIVDALNKALGWAGVNIARASLINPVSLSDAKAVGQSTSTYGTTSSGSSASYAGAQSITFNFYNQGNVVGSGGLEELALLIDSILQRNARYA